MRYADLIVITIIGVCCSMMSTPLAMSFQFERRARMYVVLSTVATAAGLRRGVRGLLEGTTIAQASMLLLFLVPCVRRLPPRLQLRR